MAYKVYWKKQGVLTEWLNQSTSKELISLQKEVQSNQRFDSLRYSIHDYRNCDQIIVDPDDMDEAAALDSAAALTNQKIVVALIATHPKVVEMMGGYLRLELSPFPIKLFTDTSKALKWLRGFGIEISPEEFH